MIGQAAIDSVTNWASSRSSATLGSACREPLAALIICLTACLSGCAARKPAAAPQGSATRILQTREGLASYYGKEFHGKTTASGVRFDMNALVAAHPTYPFGTRVRVTNLENRRSTTVRVVDRGPTSQIQDDGVVIDVSRRAAAALGFIQRGRARVRLDVLAWGSR